MSDRPFSRWRNERRYRCEHEDCEEAARTLRLCDRQKPHNCCGEHDE